METNYNHINEENISEGIYCHVANGGITFSLDKNTFRDGERVITINPVLNITGTSYGVKMTDIQLPTTPKSLRNLGEWCIKQADLASTFTSLGSSTHVFEFIGNEKYENQFNTGTCCEGSSEPSCDPGVCLDEGDQEDKSDIKVYLKPGLSFFASNDSEVGQSERKITRDGLGGEYSVVLPNEGLGGSY